MLARFLFALVLATIAAAQQPPYLFLRRVTPAGAQALAPNRPVQVTNNERIHLQICIQARDVAERFERPEVQALNQAPGYFDHRPGPNITLSIKRAIGNERQEVPFRLNSSGLGKDLAVYWVGADIDILEDKAVRQQKAEQFMEWMASQPGGERVGQLMQLVSKGSLVSYFEEQYIHNPPGDYEITAKYTPTTAENWKGTLASTPIRIRAIDAGDFFDVMKLKLAPR